MTNTDEILAYYFTLIGEYGHGEVFFFKTRELAEAEYERIKEEDDGTYSFLRGYIDELKTSDIASCTNSMS